VDATNRFVLVADLGLDKLFVYKFDVTNGSVTPNEPPFVTVKPGSGPRHVVFHRNGRWVYLITEMGSTIIQYDWDAKLGRLKELQTVSTLPADFHGVSACSEITIHPNGKFLYASNRGHDSIAVFAINDQSGQLTAVQHVPSGGQTPRNFDLDPSGRWMIVTNHGNNVAQVLRIDPATGKLTPVGSPVGMPSPFCPRFFGPL
jgi:6-phosphogluconolactonase